MNKSEKLLESEGWIRADARRGWPPTWDRGHCGSCDAFWWVIERHSERHNDGWVLLRLPDKCAYDWSQYIANFDTVAKALVWIETYAPGEVCNCLDHEPRSC